MTRYTYMILLTALFTLTMSARAQDEGFVSPETQAICDAEGYEGERCIAFQLLLNAEAATAEAATLREQLEDERRMRKAAERDMDTMERDLKEARTANRRTDVASPEPTSTEERRSIYGTANFDHLTREDEPAPEPTVVREIVYVEHEPALQVSAPTYQAPMVMTPPPRGYTVQLGGIGQTWKKAGMALECRNGTGMTIVVGGMMIPNKAVFSVVLNQPLQTGERFQLYYELVFQGLVIETKSHRILDQKYPSTDIVTLQ